MVVVRIIGIWWVSQIPGSGVPAWFVGAYASLGVLSILTIVLGFALDAYRLAGNPRTAVTGMFIVGQWGLPGTTVVASLLEFPPLTLLAYVFGVLLVITTLIMTWLAATMSDGTVARLPDETLAVD